MRLFSKRWKEDSKDPVHSENREIIRRCIKPDDVVFDIGAHQGTWSEAVLAAHQSVDLHLFETSVGNKAKVVERLSGRARVNHMAVSSRAGDVKDQISSPNSGENCVPCTSLDAYWESERRQINFLKLDATGTGYDALRGAGRLLKRGQIDYVQFQYGPVFQGAGITLQNVWSVLRRSGYRVFSASDQTFIELKTFRKSDETYRHMTFVAVHARLADTFIGKIADVALHSDEIARHGIETRGVLQLGTDLGQQVETFRKLDLSPIVLVESNPGHAQDLGDKYIDESDIIVIHGAASDGDRPTDRLIAGLDRPGSLLPTGKPPRPDPNVTSTRHSIGLPFQLDEVLAERNVDTSRLNLVVMDAQGGGLMALRAASDLLSHVQAIQLTVTNGTRADDIDGFMSNIGMQRVVTMTPYSQDLGAGLYVRRPMVTDSRLGEMGRFANQGFQYLFLRSYSEEQGYDFANPPWIGDQLFHIQPGTSDVPKMPFSIEQQGLRFNDCSIANSPVTFPNTDILGYFQYDMRYYAPYKDILLRELAWRAPFADRAAQIRRAFDSAPGAVAAIHLRRGDYGYKYFFITPNEWYVEWLRDLRNQHPDLSVYIATDDPAAAEVDFAEFNVISVTDLGLTEHDPDFFADFAALTCADYVGVANSSFSFLASLMNTQARGYARPSLADRKLIPFDPWTSEPLLYDTTAEKAGDEFMSDKEKSRSKHRIRKFFRGGK